MLSPLFENDIEMSSLVWIGHKALLSVHRTSGSFECSVPKALLQRCTLQLSPVCLRVCVCVCEGERTRLCVYVCVCMRLCC